MTKSKKSLLTSTIFIFAVMIAALLIVFGFGAHAPVAEEGDDSTAATSLSTTAEEAHDHGAMTPLSAYPTGGEMNGEASAVSYYLTDDISGNITVKGEVTLCLNGHTITGDGNGSVITVSKNAIFTLCDCTGEGVITGGNTGYGGGVNIGNKAQFTMNGGKIFENEATDNGGGVIIGNDSQFIMNGGSITDNEAKSGGGVCVGNNTGSGTFVMNGGKITGNHATDGGGVCVMSSRFELTGGEISGNTASRYGGGVWTQASSKMSGGKITENNAQDGGGVYISINTFEMTGGEISANTASGNGGGVNNHMSTFKMSGGEISANTANSNGGGVYALYNLKDGNKYEGKFTTSGTAVISGNNADENGGGVYAELTLKASSNIPLPSPLPFSADIAVLSADNEEPDYKGTFTVLGGEIKNNSAINGGGVYSKGATVNMLGGAISENETYCGGGVYVEGVENSGDYYGELILSDGALISKNSATNGHVGYNSYGGGVSVQCGARLTMNGGEISGNTSQDGYTIDVYNGSFTMSDGKISGNDGGVLVRGDGIFTMNGGEISGNGYVGVSILGGTFIMTDGTISNNDNSGVYLYDGGTFTMYGGIISRNASSYDGGGVDVVWGTFTMNGGTITDNTANEKGGGVYVSHDSEFTMTGGTISENTATAVYDEENSEYVGGYGGGVYVFEGTFTMTGGTVSNNTATVEGGGVYVYDSFNISGTPIITGNKVNDSDNNVEVHAGGYIITVTGELEEGAKIGVYGTGELIVGFTSTNDPTGKKPSAYFIPDSPVACIGVSDTETGTVTIGGEHTGGTATCTAKAICTVCDLPYDEIDPDNHVFATDYTVDKEPTCTEKGSKSKHCTLCDNAKTDVTDIPANGHALTHCETQGATCETDGVLAHDHCSVCDKDFIDGVEKTAAELKIAAAHTWGSDAVRVEPTCEADGSVTSTCTVCGERDVQVLPKLGHSYGEWSIDKAATCTEEGTKSKHCSICDEKSEVTTIPVIPHTLTHIPEVPATEESEGNIEYWDCEVCDKIFSDEDGVNEITDKASLIIPKQTNEDSSDVWIALIVILCLVIAVEVGVIVYREKRKAKAKENK